MRSDRLLSILLLLQTRHRVTAADLAARLEVSVRTVYRDIEALSAAGVPVYADRGRHGGIRLLPGYRTDVTGLTEQESRALFVLAAGAGTHAALGLGEAFSTALRKVMAALPAPHRPAAEATGRRVLVDPARWLPGLAATHDLTPLLGAVEADRRLVLHYRHADTAVPRRYTVDPYGLVAKAGVWYLAADHRRRARIFRVDRLLRAEVTGAPVRRRPGVELTDVWEELRSGLERRNARVRVTARVRRGRLEMMRRIVGGYLDEEPPPQPSGTVGDDGDGASAHHPQVGHTAAPADGEWVTVSLRYPEIGAVHQLLQFGADVEVLGPPRARELLARAADTVHRLYAPVTHPVGGNEGPDGDGM